MHIKTSKENKEVVTQLTRRFGLGAENVIARIAMSYSLAKRESLNIKNLKDSGGKEYSKGVLFGEYYEIYLGMICMKYNLYKDDKDLAKYFKLHLDNGLNQLYHDIGTKSMDDFTMIQTLIPNSY